MRAALVLAFLLLSPAIAAAMADRTGLIPGGNQYFPPIVQPAENPNLPGVREPEYGYPPAKPRNAVPAPKKPKPAPKVSKPVPKVVELCKPGEREPGVDKFVPKTALPELKPLKITPPASPKSGWDMLWDNIFWHLLTAIGALGLAYVALRALYRYGVKKLTQALAAKLAHTIATLEAKL